MLIAIFNHSILVINVLIYSKTFYILYIYRAVSTDIVQ